MNVTPKNILRAELANMQAYHVADSSGLIKLDAMENPYIYPATLKEQWLTELKQVDLNRYPNPHASELKKTLQQAFSLSPKLELIFGNGSDELIQLLVMAIAKPNASILTVTPSFSMYKLIAEYIGVNVVEVPLQQDSFALQIDLLEKAMQEHQPAIIFLACPNNPTGTLWPQDQVENIIKQATGLVVIDEAYSPFAAYSMMSLVERYPHALMMRTVSKMGLAGLRLGWMLGEGRWVNELDKMRLPYNINVLTQVSTNFALRNIAVFNQQAEQICQQREVLSNALQVMENIEVFPSEANFILFRVLSGTADRVYQHLLDNKIIIKNVSSGSFGNDLLENCLRVTVGTEKENQAFINVLSSAFS
ncbi:MAG: histidinol-phosphate transaminase [Gammaproteobacteria bacterium]|nr:MAG: histidinol-phosphate transaminase [Gammaproteobacteria bacterium]